MTNTTKIMDDVMNLSPVKRAKLIDQLLSSLDKPDTEIDKKWKKEAENRLKAVREGKIRSVPLAEILSKYQA